MFSNYFRIGIAKYIIKQKLPLFFREHVREAHGGSWNKESPHEDWEFSLEGNFTKPLDREVNEFIRIRRAKCSGQARIQGERTKVAREVFNSKEEWYSHVSQRDIVG